MSDHDRFKDFLPDQGFDLPPTAQFYGRVRELHDRYLEQAIEKMKESLDGAGVDELDRYLAEGTTGLIPAFVEKRVPLALEGAEELSIDAIYSPDEDEQYSIVPVHLYRDGSPFIPEKLLDKGVSFNQAWIVASPAPEERPFIMHFDEREREAEASGKKHISVLEFKLQKREQGEPLSILTDQQTVELLGYLEQQEIDLVDMRDQVPRLR